MNKTGYTNDEDYGKIIKLSFNQKVKKALPHPKFYSVYIYKDWYYGEHYDSDTEATSLYKFKLGGKEKLLTSFRGYMSGIEFGEDLITYSIQDEEKEREIQN